MDFKKRVKDDETKNIEILQLNIIKACNLKCTHCHVKSSPDRKEIMSKEIFDKTILAYEKFGLNTIDITGGEPTIHPMIDYFLNESIKRSENVIMRTNSIGIMRKEKLVKILKENNINLVVSLPCYSKENVDSMRGLGSFEKIIKSLKFLNGLGYGKQKKLDLVYNPSGAFLPPSQKELEKDYKRELEKENIVFNNLLTITNIPIGYFGENLKKNNNYEEYMKLLEDNFNENTLEGLMCRNQISVDTNGNIYDCDFNQMEKLKCKSYKNIDELLSKNNLKRNIKFKNYCYGCTAGAGSSCGGALNE